MGNFVMDMVKLVKDRLELAETYFDDGAYNTAQDRIAEALDLLQKANNILQTIGWCDIYNDRKG